MDSVLPDFISEYHIDPTICDQLVDLFYAAKSTNLIHPGRTGSGINTEIKDSLDLVVYAINPNWVREFQLGAYFEALQTCISQYIDEFRLREQVGTYDITESPVIQYYKPGGGYKARHFERTGFTTCTRMLAWMTYLNDVNDGGGTSFVYQGTIHQARKGKTLIWPSDFTHTHVGVISPTEEKYIITGWVNFTPEMITMPPMLQGAYAIPNQ